MTDSKQQFQRDTELSKWWISVCHDDRFGKVLTHARSHIMELGGIQAEHIQGVLMLGEVLKTLSDNEDMAPRVPRSGLIHDFAFQESLRKQIESKTKP